jgi:hypothetical protein
MWQQQSPSNLTNRAWTTLADWVTKPQHQVINAPPSYLLHPNQGRPASTTWNFFIKTLQWAYTTDTTNTLVHPLGRWFKRQSNASSLEPDVQWQNRHHILLHWTPNPSCMMLQLMQCIHFQCTQTNESATFPLLPELLTPISSHFQHDFWQVWCNGIPNCSQASDFKWNDSWQLTQAKWDGKAIICRNKPTTCESLLIINCTSAWDVTNPIKLMSISWSANTWVLAHKNAMILIFQCWRRSNKLISIL